MRVDIQQLIEKARELPSISPYSLDLLNLIDAVNTPRMKILQMVSVDDVLYAQVLRYANSLALGYGSKVDNLEKALDVIGLSALKQIIFMLAARKSYVVRDLWPRNLYQGIAGLEFGERLDKSQACLDTIFMSGVMQNIGLLTMLKFFNEEYKEVSVLKNKYKQLDMEEEIFGVNRFQLASKIFEEWNLPERVVNTVKYQNRPKDDNYTELNAILEIAEELRTIQETNDKDKIRFITGQKKYSKLNLDRLQIDPKTLINIKNRSEAILQL